MKTTKPNLYQQVTDQIITAIQEGCPPWQKPWTGSTTGAALPLRHNGEYYRGINILVLWSIAASKGYTSAHWLTFQQAKTLGGRVRKGEKSSSVIYYGVREIEDPEAEEETKRIPFARAYRVFNADQIDDLPAKYYDIPEPARDLGTERNPELEAFFEATGADIQSSEKPKAYYDIRADRIHMPPVSTFHNAGGYYATLAHELTHWTGAAKRLDRFDRFSDRKAYAFEELVAEIGNCLICSTLGLTPDFQQSGAYIEGWLKAMKEDNRTIFRAASEAQKALDFVQGLTSPQQMAAE